MLDQILEDKLERTPASNEPIVRDGFNYDSLVLQSRAIALEWGQLTKLEQADFGGLALFQQSKGVRDLKDPSLSAHRNRSIIRSEIKTRSESPEPLSHLIHCAGAGLVASVA